MDPVDIERLIPHRGRMKLVGKVLEAYGNVAVTSARAKESWPLIKNGRVSPIVVLELVAQTSAVSIGWKDFSRKGERFQGMGWLVGVKKADFFEEYILIDSVLTTRAEVRFNMENYFEITGSSRVGSDCIGEVTLQVVKSNEQEL